MALVISRKPGESVRIGSALVTVRKSAKGRISLAIDAPKNVIVRRGELPDQDQAPAAIVSADRPGNSRNSL